MDKIEIFQFGKLVLIIGEYVFSDLRECGTIDQFMFGLLVKENIEVTKRAIRSRNCFLLQCFSVISTAMAMQQKKYDCTQLVAILKGSYLDTPHRWCNGKRVTL